MNEPAKAGMRSKSRGKKLLLIVVAFLLLGAAGVILAGDAVDDCKLYELEVGGSAFEYSCPAWCRQRVKQESSRVLASYSEAKTCQNYSPSFLIGFRDSGYLERRARIHACVDSGGYISGSPENIVCQCRYSMPVDQRGACLTLTESYMLQLQAEGKCTLLKNPAKNVLCGAGSYCERDQATAVMGTCQKIPAEIQQRLGGSYAMQIPVDQTPSRIDFETSASMDEIRTLMKPIVSPGWERGVTTTESGFTIGRINLSLTQIMKLAASDRVKLISPAD